MLFRRLAVFIGGCTLEAAEAVCGEPGLDVLEGMSMLVEQSLLQRREVAEAVPRFGMLETIREYALTQLAASGEEDGTRAAHAAYFLALAEQLVPEAPGAEIVSWIGVIEREHPNLRAALAWFAEAADPTPFLRLATRLWQFWYYKANFREGRQWLERAVARADETSAALQIKVLHHAGQMAHYHGDDERAVLLLQEALARSRSLDPTWVTGHALLILGIVEEDRGEFARAEPVLREALALFQAGRQPSLGGLNGLSPGDCRVRGGRDRASGQPPCGRGCVGTSGQPCIHHRRGPLVPVSHRLRAG